MRIKILIYITPPVVDIKTISWKITIDIGYIGGIKWWNFNFYSGLFFQNLKSLLSFLFYALPIKEKTLKNILPLSPCIVATWEIIFTECTQKYLLS